MMQRDLLRTLNQPMPIYKKGKHFRGEWGAHHIGACRRNEPCISLYDLVSIKNRMPKWRIKSRQTWKTHSITLSHEMVHHILIQIIEGRKGIKASRMFDNIDDLMGL